jgi:hypothetical protein
MSGSRREVTCVCGEPLAADDWVATHDPLQWALIGRLMSTEVAQDVGVVVREVLYERHPRRFLIFWCTNCSRMHVESTESGGSTSWSVYRLESGDAPPVYPQREAPLRA